ncbi:hypothetical protein LPJ53_002726 [Coemansia erecta]|uniref:Uncharacterized protein n=1 Tax=Coemansia erecta TaxID=147472 RepID=A0A9W7XXN3_9FUNG|nr:hypothetical protein LPJ53_002726 [Coemansia erecta]
MLDIDNTTKPVDRSINRHSWSSDSPSSSSNSVRSGKDTNNNGASKGSLWSKLRKQASRMHSSASHQGSAFSTAQHSRSSVSVEPRNTWALSMDQPRPMTASGGRPGGANRAASHLFPRNEQLKTGDAPLQRPTTAHSMDIPRHHALLRASTDMQPGMYAQEGARAAGAGRPRFRRLLLGSAADQGSKPLVAPMNFIEAHPAAGLAAAGLARIAEDDEHPGTSLALFAGAAQPSTRYGGHAGLRTDKKRFSENSGSTVSSSDTTVGDGSEPPLRLRLSIGPASSMATAMAEDEKFVPSPTREHPPELLPLVHGQAGKNVPLDPLVYRNTFFNARPAVDQQNLELAIRKNSAYRPLSKRASDDTLDTAAARSSSDPLSQGGQPSGASVRFAEASEIILPLADTDAQAEAKARLTSSLPSLARSSSATKPAASALSLKPRRPSEPTRPSTWRAETAAAAGGASVASAAWLGVPEVAPQSSPAAADAEYSRRMVAEVVALKRTVRTLRLQNEVLEEMARVDQLGVPESVATRMRTLELENRWLRNELSRLRAHH